MPQMNPVSTACVKYEAPQGYSREDIIIVSGAGIVKAGTVLGLVTASGLYKPYDNDATDGSETAVGVLLNEVNATSANAAGVLIARHALVAKGGLVWGAGVTTEAEKTDAYTDLTARGIIVRESV